MKIRDKATGKIYAFDWKGAGPPTKEQFAQIKQQQDEGINFDDVQSGTSTSPLSVANPEPELPVEIPRGGLNDLILGRNPNEKPAWSLSDPVGQMKMGAEKIAGLIDTVLDVPKRPLRALGSKVAGTPITSYTDTVNSILGRGEGYLPEQDLTASPYNPYTRLLPKPAKDAAISLVAEGITDPLTPLVGGPGKVVAGLGAGAAGLHSAKELSEGNLIGGAGYAGLAVLGLHGAREPKINLPNEILDVKAPIVDPLDVKLPDPEISTQRYDDNGNIYKQLEQSDAHLNRLDKAVQAADLPVAPVDNTLTWPLEPRKDKVDTEGLTWDIDGPKSPLKEQLPVEVPEATGADFGPDYVNEVLRAGKRAQKGVEIAPGLNVVKQGDADVVNFFDQDGTLLASGQVKNGRITDIAKITKRFSEEELANISPELRASATDAAQQVRAKLHELGGASDPAHRSPDATRAEKYYQDKQSTVEPVKLDSDNTNVQNDLSIEDPDLEQLRQLAVDNNIPIDPSNLTPETRQNLIVSLGGKPQNPFIPPSKPGVQPKKRKPKSDFILNFPDWVNRRRAAQLEGQLKGREFADLNDLGPTAISEIQSGNKTNPRYADVRKYFDSKFQEVKKAGSRLSYQQDYLPQIWENNKEEVQKVFGKRLSGKSSFEFSKSIKDYQEGIAKGLTPKFKTVGELVDFYERTANKGIADKGMFNMLKNLKAISTKPKPGWIALDPNVFPITGYRKGGAVVTKVYHAPKDVADILHNYLREPDGPLRKTAAFAGEAKNWVLSSGIPGTGLNMQGLKTLVGSTLASKNPLKGGLRTAADLINPKRAAARLQKNMKDAPRYMRAGMKFSAEDFGLVDKVARSLPERLAGVSKGDGNKLKKFGKSVHEVHAHLFEDPMYQSILPATKLDHAKMIEKDLLAKGVDPEEALSTAAHAANEIFGGMNLDEIGRSKQLQDILRSSLLAPDHYESQLKLGGKMLRGLKGKKQDLIYRRMTRNLIGAYIAASVSNKITSGHWMHENPEGKQFSVQVGKTNGGKHRYIRPFGTMTDFARVPYDIVESLAKGDTGKTFSTIANRASVPASAALHIAANKDWRGRELYGPKVELKDELLNLGTEVGNVFVPTYGQAAGDYLTGKSEGEEAAAAALELPMQYGKPKKKKYLAMD